MVRELITAPGSTAPFSQAVKYGDTVYCSGTTGNDPATGKLAEGGVAAEAKQAMENLKKILEKSGSSMDQILKVTIFLADIGDFAAINEIYKGYFKEGYPARSCFEVGKLPGEALFEIECIAAC